MIDVNNRRTHLRFQKIRAHRATLTVATGGQGARADGVSGLPNRFATKALFGIEGSPGLLRARANNYQPCALGYGKILPL
jgi:hypothetical protein